MLCWWPLVAADATAPYGVAHYVSSPVLRALLGWSSLVAVTASAAAAVSTTLAVAVSGLGSPRDQPDGARRFAPHIVVVASALTIAFGTSLRPAGVTTIGAALISIFATLLCLCAALTAIWRVASAALPATLRGYCARVAPAFASVAWGMAAYSALQLKHAPMLSALFVLTGTCAIFVSIPKSGDDGSSRASTGEQDESPALHARHRTLLLAFAVVVPLVLIGGFSERIEKVSPRSSTPQAKEPINIAILMIDTLRADRTSLGAADAALTPFLRAFGAHGATYFSQAVAPASATIPSVKGLFTAMMPSAWGIPDTNAPPPPAARLMGEVFADAGYELGGFSANPLIDHAGFGRGFNRYWSANGYRHVIRSALLNDLLGADVPSNVLRIVDRLGLHKINDTTITRLAGDWLATRSGKRPFFAYVHLFGPHWPYLERGYFPDVALEAVRSDFSYVDFLGLSPGHVSNARIRQSPELTLLQHRYREEVRATDDTLRAFVEGPLGNLRDNTLIVVVGDHGEEFLEHNGFGHGHDVFEELINVPLLFVWPTNGEWDDMPVRVDAPVSLIDILPTLAEAGHIELSHEIDGRSLFPLLENTDARTAHRPVGSEAFTPQRSYGAYRDGSTKVRLRYGQGLTPWDTPHALVFDLESDPEETTPSADAATISKAQKWFADRERP